MQPIKMKFRRRVLIAGAIAAFGLAGIVGAAVDKAVTAHRAAPPAVTIRSDATAAPAAGFASVVKKDLPAVVSIATSKSVKVSQSMEDSPFSDPLFERFFGNNGPSPRQMPRNRKESALGSGVIVSSDGYILTNNHVIDNATEINVVLLDKREFKAKLIGGDAKTDIAVLKIDATNLPTVTFANSSRVQIGDYALAIGNPFGVGQTVTMGIVSATGRGNLGIEDYEDFIQTDAAINPGNSGGALVNSQGDLIGINTAIISPNSGGNNGVGFAIPSNMAHSIMDQIVTKGKVMRAYIGVTLQPVTPALAKVFNLKDTRGALVGDVSADTPASRAGLKSGDVILAMNGDAVDDVTSFRNRVAMAAPGSNATLKVFRNGDAKDVAITLGDMPTNYGSRGAESGEVESGKGLLDGVSVQSLTPRLRQELNLSPRISGVVVSAVNSDSPAAAAGLRKGDVIQEANHKPVTNGEEFQAAVSNAGTGGVLLRVNRNGSNLFVAVEAK
jgi:serine protease Do